MSSSSHQTTKIIVNVITVRNQEILLATFLRRKETRKIKLVNVVIARNQDILLLTV